MILYHFLILMLQEFLPRCMWCCILITALVLLSIGEIFYALGFYLRGSTLDRLPMQFD